MKRMLKQSFVLAAMMGTAGIYASDGTTTVGAVAPYFSIRSQSENAARELVGWQNHINLNDMDKFYGSVSVTPEYTKTYRRFERHSARCLFGNTLIDDGKCPTIRVTGSRVANRNKTTDWLADYFGLPTDYDSEVTIKPRIDNFLVDFNFYLGLDEWVSGMYFRIHAPVVHTRWELNFKEIPKTSGSASSAQGYYSATSVARSSLVSSFEEFIQGNESLTVSDTVGTITLNALDNAKWSKKRKTKTALADIQAAWGWNFYQDEDYHVGLNIRGAAPTGNRPDGEFLFEPIAGNGKHWELGAGLTSHAVLWRSEDEESNFALYFDANVTHLFKARQKRVFDLQGKPLSRYMLAQKIGSDRRDPQLINQDIALNQPLDEDSRADADVEFQNEFTQVANLSKLNVNVSVGVQADLVLKFAYTRGNFAWDFGYNFWGRSCEKIRRRSDCPAPDGFAENTWALKGDAHVIGFRLAQNAVEQVPVRLAATQSAATINAGTNNFVGPNGEDGGIVIDNERVQPTRNPGIDNRKLAATSNAGDTSTVDVTDKPTDDGTRITRSSNDVVFIKSDDLDLESARTRGLSSKVFTHLSYTWSEHEDWIPFLGVGGEVEFAHRSRGSKDCDTTCPTKCQDCALSQWGVWVKGGVSWN